MFITDIIPIDKKRVKVYLDNEFAFVLYKGELRLYNISVGEEMPNEVFDKISDEILLKRAKLRAMNLLAKKDYTEKNIRKKLEDGYYNEKQIEDTIDNFNKFDYSTMGIICKTKSQAKQIYDKLKDKYEVNLLDIDSLEFKEGIIISTIHMSKGLEFDEIVIPMVDVNNYESDYDRNLLYIACTRAMHKLTLTYHNEITDILSNINI